MRLDLALALDAYPAPVSEPRVLVKIDTSEPIEIGAFVSLFVGLGNEFERFTERDEDQSEARFFVKEIREGCIEAHLVAYAAAALPALGTVFAGFKYANDLAKFVDNLREKIGPYFKRGGRLPDASKSELGDFARIVQSIAADPDGRLELSAAEYADDERQIRASFTFGTPEAREAERQIADHRRELDATTDAEHGRVLMSFVKTDKRSATPGKRSGEAVVISSISNRALPIVYASNLAEQRIKHEIVEGAENIYKRAFDVDVNVERRGDKPIAYRIVAVHAVIDLPDD